MTLLELADIIDYKLDSDLRAPNRLRVNNYAKKVFCKLGYEMDRKTTFQQLGDILGQKHETALHNKNTFYLVTDVYREVYNEIVIENDIPLELLKTKNNVKPVKPVEVVEEVIVVEQPKRTTSAQDKLLEAISYFSDKDVEDFMQTRFYPYVNMLKSKVIPKKIPLVKGHLIERIKDKTKQDETKNN